MLRLLAPALLTLLALPALAVTPQAGDTFVLTYGPSAVVHMDAATGNATIVSCWGTCAPAIGSGPLIAGNRDFQDLKIGPDGALYVAGQDLDPIVYRIDIETGDRTAYADFEQVFPVELGRGAVDAFNVWPAPGFFPPAVASLGGWGLAVLVLGILIGVQVRYRA